MTTTPSGCYVPAASATDRCYYVPTSELGRGRNVLTLRLVPALNNQRIGVRFADDYLEFGMTVCQRHLDEVEVERAGIEPAASALQTPRSTN